MPQPSRYRSVPLSPRHPSRTVALLQAALVTLLWSSSWVLIKIGLRDLDLQPLGFAGLRYTLAAAILLPFAIRPLRACRPDRKTMGALALLGLTFYAVTQGAQFVALGLLPAASVGLILTVTPALVLIIGAVRGSEVPTWPAVAGLATLLTGAALFFNQTDGGTVTVLGITVAAIGMLGNAVSSLLGRSVARTAAERIGGATAMTTVSMLVGGLVLLATGVATEGMPQLSLPAWGIVAWLALVNTAIAFTLWNHTLRVLTAVESSVMNQTMLAQIALLAWLFLGETVGSVQVAGLVLVMAGVALVQVAPAISGRLRTE